MVVSTSWPPGGKGLCGNMNVVLIGMPGAGKSTLGVLLAKALGLNYIDTDIIIQQQEGRLLQEIIDTDGLEKFLQTEAEIVARLKVQDCVIATGGSVVYSEKAMNALKRTGRVFYLSVAYEEIARRLKDVATRGIAVKKGRSLRDIYTERVPLYLGYADHIIDCHNKNIEDCISEIAARVKEKQIKT